jgi:hypothetical protein
VADDDFTSFEVFPHRTIDVGPPDGSQEPRLVVHNFSGHSPGAWATLSHCWGGSAPLKTTKSTLEQRKQGIPMHDMPDTFRDAVIITRRLGIRHLWIDSLCIVQDSLSDWNAEAGTMGNIYEYGLINIAADTASGCEDGIFPRREKPCIIKLPLDSQKQNIHSEMYARCGRWDSYRPGILGDESTLTSRGWCLQESMLSPRTLHYAKQQLFWECRHFTFAEVNMQPCVDRAYISLIGGLRWSSLKMLLPSTAAQAHPDSKVASSWRADTHDSWLSIVENYTQRHLTRSSDIFIALSGIAHVFKTNLGDRDLAGLLEGNLLASLLWRSIDPFKTEKRTLHVPSWSWAYVVGAVAFEIRRNSNNQLPQLRGKLAAEVRQASVPLYENFSESGLASDCHSSNFILEGQVLEQTTAIEDFGYLRQDAHTYDSNEQTPNRLAYKRASFSFDTKDSAVLKAAQPLAILHIGIWEWWWHARGGHPSRFERVYAGLLLRATDETKSSYERIGIARMEMGFRNVTDESLFTHVDERFLEDGWRRSTVSIV